MKKFYTLLLICAAGTGYSQQGFGTSNPAPSSVIDMVASNKGALLPRVTLTSTAVAAPVPSPANALTVFNTATTGDVTPGYYYWSAADSKWIRLMDANIYTADGTLTNTRTLTINDKSLNFVGSDQMTQWGSFGYFYQMALDSSIYGNASMAFLAADRDSNGQKSRMDIQTFPEGDAVVNATGDATSLTLSTNATTNSAPIIFTTSAGANALGTEKMRITGEGNVGINNSTPTENLHVSGNARFDNLPLDGTANAIFTMPDGNASSSQDQTFTATKTVVTDANGVLGYISGTPLTTEVDGVVGNEVTNATVNGGLIRIGTGTNADPYTLGLTNGTSTGQLMTWNGTSWAPTTPTVTNIYNANGSLNSNRTLTNNGFGLTFLGTNQSTTFPAIGGISQRGLASNKRASIILSSDDNNSNAVSSNMQLFQDPENLGQITVGNDSRGLNIGSTATTQAAPIIFMTSAGSNAAGTEKMRITEIGNVGVNTGTPTEKLDNNGITRLRTLPLNGAANAINTTPGGTASASQDQTFTGTRTVVADANGVLGYVSGLPSTTSSNSWYNVATNTPATANTQNIYQMGKVGVMTTTPTSLFNVYNNSSSINPFTVESDNAGSGLGNDAYFYGYGTSMTPGLFFLSSRGTKAAPAVLQNGDLMGEYNFGGYLSTGWNYTLTSVRSSYDGNGTSTDSSLDFLTSGLGRIKIAANGNVGINTSTPNSTLVVEGSYEGAFKEVSASTTLTISDQFVNAVGSSALMVTLPDGTVSNSFSGRVYNIKNTSAADLTIAGFAAGQLLRTADNTTSNTLTLRPGTSLKVVKNNYSTTANPLWEVFDQSTINVNNNTQALTYARSVTSPINASTPANSEVSIGNISIRFNGTTSSAANIEYKVSQSNHVTILYHKGGSGGTSLEEWGRQASVAGTWYSFTGEVGNATRDINPSNRDIGYAIIALHNTKDVYRITANVNGDIPVSGSVPAVSSSVTLFVEKLSL